MAIAAITHEGVGAPVMRTPPAVATPRTSAPSAVDQLGPGMSERTRPGEQGEDEEGNDTGRGTGIGRSPGTAGPTALIAKLTRAVAPTPIQIVSTSDPCSFGVGRGARRTRRPAARGRRPIGALASQAEPQPTQDTRQRALRGSAAVVGSP